MFDDEDEDNNSEITYNHLPSQSFRTALILDRFSLRCNILYCSNDLLIDSGDSLGRSFFDYVSRNSETNVRDWINLVKGWGVNETGQPSDGGFGFGKFALLKEGRESEECVVPTLFWLRCCAHASVQTISRTVIADSEWGPEHACEEQSKE